MIRRALLILALAGCGPRAVTSPPPVDPKPPAPPPVDVEGVKAKVGTAFEAELASLAHADVDGYLTGVAPEAYVIGTGVDDIVMGRNALESVMHEELDPLVHLGVVFEAAPHDVRIGVSPDGHAAWLSANVDFAAAQGEHRVAVPYRVTAAYKETEDGWRVVAQHSSVAAPADATRTTGVAFPDDVPDNAAAVTAVVVGKDVTSLITPQTELVGETPRAPSTIFGAPLSAGILPGGQIAWVAGGLDAPGGTERGPDVLAYRALAIFQRDGDTWRLVQLHVSLPHTD